MTKNINNTSLASHTIHLWWVDSIDALSDFFPIWVNSKNQASFIDLEWKNIADIWAWFSDFISKMKWYVWKSSRLFCIDPIYNDEHLEWWLLKARNHFKSTTEEKIMIKEILFNNKDLAIDILDKYNKNKAKKKKADKWSKLEWITYKVELEESDSVDLVTVTNLFYKIEEPVVFIEWILNKLNENWELIIIDYPEVSDHLQFNLLNELEKKGIVESKINEKHRVYKIKKEDFLGKLEDIKRIFIYLKNKEELNDEEGIDDLMMDIFTKIWDLLNNRSQLPIFDDMNSEYRYWN